MGVMLGFFVGYVAGTRAGQEGFEELVRSVRQILGSAELKEVFGGAAGLLGEAVRAGSKAAGERGLPAVRRVA